MAPWQACPKNKRDFYNRLVSRSYYEIERQLFFGNSESPPAQRTGGHWYAVAVGDETHGYHHGVAVKLIVIK